MEDNTDSDGYQPETPKRSKAKSKAAERAKSRQIVRWTGRRLQTFVGVHTTN